MKKTIIIGATGMLGSAVYREFIKAGLAVQGSGRAQRAGFVHFEARSGDGELERLLADLSSGSYVINCAAVLSSAICDTNAESVRAAIEVNSLFPHRLAAAAGKRGLRVIHVSTDGVFSRRAGCCLESTPTDAEDSYGKSKQLGEVAAEHVLNIRCSIVGPSPGGRQGLFDWLLGQPANAAVSGFSDQTWNGVTTLQFAKLCGRIVGEDHLPALTKQNPMQHFCPNSTVTKYELLRMIARRYRPDVTVERSENPARAVNRYLASEYTGLKELFGTSHSLEEAIAESSELLT